MAIQQMTKQMVNAEIQPRIAIFGQGTLVSSIKTIYDNENNREVFALGLYGVNPKMPFVNGKHEIPTAVNKMIDEEEFAPIMLAFTRSEEVHKFIGQLTYLYGEMVRSEAIEEEMENMLTDEEAEEVTEEQYDDAYFEHDEELESGFNYYCSGEQDCLDTAMEMANAKALELMVQALNAKGIEVTYEEVADLNNLSFGFFLFMLDVTIGKEGGYVVTKLEDEPILYASATPEIDGNSVGFEYKLV